MPFAYSEAEYEKAVVELFTQTLDYESLYGPDTEQDDYREPLYPPRLEEALKRIEPDAPVDAFEVPNGENSDASNIICYAFPTF